MRIADICTRCVETIGLDATAADAAAAMLRTHVGTLVVLGASFSGGKPVGIVTDRDLVLKVLAKGIAAHTISVADVMSRELHTCKGAQEVFVAAQEMRRHGVRRLPVLDELGHLIGMISTDDIQRALADHMRELSQAMTNERVIEAAWSV